MERYIKISMLLSVPLEIRQFRYSNSVSREAKIILSFLQSYVIFVSCGPWISLQN